MYWQDRHIDRKHLYSGYQKKYGLTSDYQVVQKILYARPAIRRDLLLALGLMQIIPGDKLLDIGVNNAYELRFLEKVFGKTLLRKTDIISYDLVEDALRHAAWQFRAYKNLHFIKGNIFNFRGKDVATNKTHTVADGSLDEVVAFTSLQSTSLSSVLATFIYKLNRKLKPRAQLLIVVPNCYVDERRRVVKGLWNDKKGRVDRQSSLKFTENICKEFIRYGFKFKRTGSDFIFLYFYRQ